MQANMSSETVARRRVWRVGAAVLILAASAFLFGCSESPTSSVNIGESEASACLDNNLDGRVGDAEHSSVPLRYERDMEPIMLDIQRPRVATLDAYIDFENPHLDSEYRQVISPYTDSSTGVSFEVVGAYWGDETIGLVRNSSTSSCAEPRDGDQKLATGRGTSIGFSRFPIKCIFSGSLGIPLYMSVEFQQGLGTMGRICVYDASHNLLAEQTAMTTVDMGTCGYPGNPRSRVRVSTLVPQAAAYAILDAPFSNAVFVIDDVHLEYKLP